MLPARSAGLAGILLVAVALVPMAASAHFWGGNWFYWGTTLLPLTYTNGTGGFPAYTAAVDQGARNWYNTATPSDLISTSGWGNIYVYTYSDSSDSNWGVTSIQAMLTICGFLNNQCYSSLSDVPPGGYADPTPLGGGYGNYAQAYVALNRATLDSEGDFIKTKVATHELGHAQGLAHPLNQFAWFTWQCTAVMQQGRLSFNTPQPHDVFDFNRLYPSTIWAQNQAC